MTVKPTIMCDGWEADGHFWPAIVRRITANLSADSSNTQIKRTMFKGADCFVIPVKISE